VSGVAASEPGSDPVGQRHRPVDDDADRLHDRRLEMCRLFGDGASQFVTESDVAESIPCGADVEEFAST
jgi:hypothetical protein